MHPDPTLRIMAVVTACCQEARRAQRKFTPILLFIAVLLFIAILLVIINHTSELVMDLAHPARHGVSVIAWVWREVGSRLEVRVRIRAIDSGRGTRSSNKLESISTVTRWCCQGPSWSGWLGCSFIRAYFLVDTHVFA
jgi:hypothetical protein